MLVPKPDAPYAYSNHIVCMNDDVYFSRGGMRLCDPGPDYYRVTSFGTCGPLPRVSCFEMDLIRVQTFFEPATLFVPPRSIPENLYGLTLEEFQRILASAERIDVDN